MIIVMYRENGEIYSWRQGQSEHSWRSQIAIRTASDTDHAAKLLAEFMFKDAAYAARIFFSWEDISNYDSSFEAEGGVTGVQVIYEPSPSDWREDLHKATQQLEDEIRKKVALLLKR
jgi:hypothetical protein